MARPRRDGTTKVWHNPEISGRRGGHSAAPRVAPTLEERKTANAHRAALEALFSPKKVEDDSGKSAKSADGPAGKLGRIVLTPPPQADPRGQDRQRLLAKLLAASGRPAITKAANELFKQSFVLPQEQDVYLQLLEHTSEQRVREAIAALQSILLGELPKRRAVLESRLRRIEEYAEEEATRTAAADLWRQLTGRGIAPSTRSGGAEGPASGLSSAGGAPAAPPSSPVSEQPLSAARDGAGPEQSSADASQEAGAGPAEEPTGGTAGGALAREVA